MDPFPSTESLDNSEKSMISSSRGDDLTCQQEVSIGRACSEPVGPPETWKGQLLPSSQTYQYAYILGLVFWGFVCPSVLNPGCYLVQFLFDFVVVLFIYILLHWLIDCCIGFH